MRLGVEPLDYVVNRILIEALIEAARNVTDVRSRQQVRLVAERVIQRQRLLIEDVNGRARDLAFSQRFEEVGPRPRSVRAMCSQVLPSAS